MSRLDDALTALRGQARPDQLPAMSNFGMTGNSRLGVSVPALRRLGRQLGPDQALALALWDTGIPDAQILAAMVAEPERLTVRQMNAWAASAHSWDVCDQACNNAYVRSPLAWARVAVWAKSPEEFVRRAAFALLACLAVHDKAAADARFIDVLPLIEAASDDDRNFVRKAVNWALRQIGKRNAALKVAAIASAERIAARGTRAARWIATDALRELRGNAVRLSLARPRRRCSPVATGGVANKLSLRPLCPPSTAAWPACTSPTSSPPSTGGATAAPRPTASPPAARCVRWPRCTR
jgi:3-methyladenine DNA glycosylase AlkD